MLKQSEIFGTRLNTKVERSASDLVDVSCERTPQFPAQWLQQAQVEVAGLLCAICVVRLEFGTIATCKIDPAYFMFLWREKLLIILENL